MATLLVGHDLETIPHHVQEFARPEQEVRVRRPADALLPELERLVDQQAAGSHGSNQIVEQRPMQVISDDHRIELLTAERRRHPCLQVELHQQDPGIACRGATAADVPVDAGHPEAARERQSQMPPSSASDVERAGPLGGRRKVSLHPFGWRHHVGVGHDGVLQTPRPPRGAVGSEGEPTYILAMPAENSISFRKMNGLGNEIVVVDLRASDKVFTPEEARRIAQSPHAHFDQMMVLHAPKTPGTDAFVRIYNTDGSEAGACGNGTRCIGWVVSRESGKTQLRFETRPGILDVDVEDIGRITVDMGEPRFDWRDIPLSEEFRDTRAIELQVGPIDAPIIHSPSVVNVGNPHAIFWVDNLDVIDLAKVGPMLEHHRLFPERANISLAKVRSPEVIDLKTWERGAGLTRACGSAACAALVCAARKKLTGRRATVNVPGGPLIITWTPANRILMTGPAEDEYTGEIAL